MIDSSIDLSDFQTPGRGGGLADVIRRRYLLGLLVRKGTSTRYRNAALGWMWSYSRPLSQYVIYYFVMGVLLGNNRGIDDFAVYLLSGIIAINFFNESFGAATKSITDNKALVKKIYLPRELFPVAAVLNALVHFLPQMGVLIIAGLLSGWRPSMMTIGTGLLGIGILTLLSTGLGLIFGAINVAYRDAQNLVDVIRLFVTWTAPVMYSWKHVGDALPHWAEQLYLLNPLTTAVGLLHRGFWYMGPADSVNLIPHLWRGSIIAIVITAVVIVIGQLVFRRRERTFAQDL
ncbi:ABC transporter permease [Gryllotalpicola kribbensis]|uniref:Transport permease protein n=1 Tax=Gryllotalpicola kribbensis TaxID=993084 RepID=A0ABP8AMP6_9MICO